MTNDEKIRRAEEAKRLLDHPLLKEASEYIEGEFWRKFKELAPTDIDGIAQVKAMQYMHTKYAAFLRSVIVNGAVEKLQLEEKRPRPKGY